MHDGVGTYRPNLRTHRIVRKPLSDHDYAADKKDMRQDSYTS